MASEENGDRLKAIADSVYLRLASQVVTIILAPAIVYLLSTTQSIQRDISVIQEQINGINAQILLRTLNRYTAEDAKRDKALFDSEIADHERRIERLEQKP